MSIFSDKLAFYIKASGFPLHYLSEKSGLELTYLSKIKKGERLPSDRQKVKRLIESLRLPPDDSEILYQSYLRVLLGEENYWQNVQVKSLLESIGNIPTISFFHACPTDDEKKYTVYHRQDVHRLIRTVFEDELHQDNPQIKLILQPEDTTIMAYLASLYTENPINIQHILCLQTQNKHCANQQNLAQLEKILPNFLSHPSYEVLYYYDDLSSHNNAMNLFPYLILTQRYSVRISHNFDFAEADTRKTSLEISQFAYRKIAERCKPFFVKSCCLTGTYPFPQNALFILSQEPPSLMFDQPCPLQNMGKPSTLYFSETCLQNLQPAIIHKLVQQCEYGRYIPILIKEKYFHPPSNVALYLFNTGVVSIQFRQTDKSNIIYTIQETSLSDSVQQFLKYLGESEFVYSREESFEKLTNAQAINQNPESLQNNGS